jgi:hypothetical protein
VGEGRLLLTRVVYFAMGIVILPLMVMQSYLGDKALVTFLWQLEKADP